MARIRANYVYGTLGAAIDADDTTITSTALARLPAVTAPDVAAISLLDGDAGVLEIVWVTEHTASATSATIARAQEGTTAAIWGSGTPWVLGITQVDVAEFTTRATLNNAQTGTAYTLVLADAEKFVTMSNAAASTLTVPPNSSVAFPVGTVIEGAQLGAGQVTLTPGAGVTINATPGLKVAAQYGTFALKKLATDTWLAMGRLAA